MGMTTSKAWANWKNWLGTYRRPAHRGRDFADYGTAFGLDMSLSAATTAEAASTATAQPQSPAKTATAPSNLSPQENR